jgi:tetratricopeptide (TPR) repeat protein
MQRLLYGRVAELTAIEAGLEEARRGHTRAFALTGEAGIGKTRLATEVAERAAVAGFQPCWGRAWEAGGAPAYWPWRLLLESLPGLGAPAGALSLVWGRKSVGPAADPDQARFDLFDAVAAAIRFAAAGRPLLCILDDLHAADLPSLELAAFVARHLRDSRVLWLLTWRDAEAERPPCRALIARVARDATALPLARLSAEDTASLVVELARETVPKLGSTLYGATAGNPLFLVETVACLNARGEDMLPTLERLPLAQGVAAVVSERVAALRPAARRTLEAASLLGRDLDLDRWAEAAEMPPSLVKTRAREITAAGFLVESGAERWTFSHELVREAIRREVPDDLVRAAHRRVALALDRRVQAGELSLLDERLHHALRAQPAVEPEVVLGWAIAAAGHARAQCGYEEVLALLDRTQAALGTIATRHAGFLLATGRAHGDLGNVAAAREALHGAIAIARSAGDARTRAEAVLAYGSRYVFGDILDELVAMIDEAAAALGDGDRDLRARLLARKAAALTPAERPDEVLAMAREALAMVGGSTDTRARLDVAVAAGSAFGDFAHPRERIPVNLELVRLVREERDRALELRGLSRLVTDYIEAGDFSRADGLLVERDALAQSLKLPRFAWNEPLFRSMRAMADGRFADCHDAVAEAESRAATLDDANALRCIAVHRAWLLLLQDDVDALRTHESRLIEAVRSMPPVIAPVMRAVIRLRAGDVEAAREEIDALDPSLPHGGINILATLAEVVAEVGPDELARTLIVRLEPYADTNACWGLFGLVCGPPVAASLGCLYARLDEREQARRRFDLAVERATASGARALRAWSRYRYGRALAAWNDGRGKTLLDEAAREASELGMGLAARCEAPAPQSSVEWSLKPQAGAWLVQRGAASFLVPDLRGMPMLARLVAHADTEIHSLELVSGREDTREADGDAGELLDGQARAEYKRRIADLEQIADEARERGDAARAETARGERETLVRELSRAVGRGGKSRRAGAAAERARVSAQRCIREAIRRIVEVDADLGAHLERTIRTGIFCIYQPLRRNH